MRLPPLLFAFLLVSASACGTEPTPNAQGSVVPTVNAGADTPEAILDALRPGLLADAFANLDAMAYSATLSVTELAEDGTVRGTFTSTVQRDAGGALRVAASSGDGTLSNQDAVTAEHAEMTDPLSSVLPDPPPFLDPASREKYVLRMLPGSTRGAEAVADSSAEKLAVRRAALTLDASGQRPARIEVLRRTSSPVFSETTRADATLELVGDALIPTLWSTETHISTMLGESRHLRLVWTVTAVNGKPISANAR